MSGGVFETSDGTRVPLAARPPVSSSSPFQAADTGGQAASGTRETDWTPDQRAGITTVGTGLLVSAAAGSGKTAVLAERCAHLVCDAPPPYRCDVDELLVLTFTKAAAAEMRHRIGAAIHARIKGEDKGDPAERERLEKQLLLIDRASITTLDAFCTRLLRRHFHLLGLDPNFVVLDQEEAKLLRRDVARDLFDEQYDGGRAAAFEALIDRWAGGNDAVLIDRVIALHDLLGSVSDPAAWRAEAAARVREAAAVETDSPPARPALAGRGEGALAEGSAGSETARPGPLKRASPGRRSSGGNGAIPLPETELGKALAAALAEELRGLLGRCDRVSETAGRVVGLEKFVTHLAGLRPVIERWVELAEAGNLAALAEQVAAFDPGKQHRAPQIKNPPAEKEVVGKEIKAIKAAMKSGTIAELCRFSAADWRATMAEVAPATALLLDLTAEFADRYEAAKSGQRGIDFADLERLTLRILTGPGGEPSAVARSLHREFRHVLVDEYQDINAMQDELLALMSTERAPAETGSNLFRVGDVKQSIYGFRLAEAKRFLELYRGLRRGEVDGTLIPLSENFRSRGPLLGVINIVFGMLMTEAAAEIDYADGHELVPGATFDGGSFTGAPVELHLLIKPSKKTNKHDGDAADEVDDEDDGPAEGLSLDAAEREAVVVAKRLRTLMGLEGDPIKLVVDKKLGPRPMRWGDAAVLLRTTKTLAEQYANVLRRCGVPVHTEAKSGFFDAVEVRDALSLLRVLDNRRQDVPLASVLRSPLAKMPGREDALARIRLAYPRRGESAVPFHEAVARYAAERDDELAARLRDIVADLDRWRDLARRRPLAEVLWAIYTETGYLAFAAGLPRGEQRAANLIELHEKARQFGTFQRQGLARFLQFLDQLADAGDLGQASVASAADDVVRIMSVHTAKGLEFPVVALSNLGKRHNLSSASGAVLFDRELGVGLEVVDDEKHVKYPSLASLLVGRSARRQALAEELRILYVAMTRGREHLICVGSCGEKQRDGWAAKWRGHARPMPAADVLRGGSMLDWLGPVAVAARGLPVETFAVHEHAPEAVEAWEVEMRVAGEGGGVADRIRTLEPLAASQIESSDADSAMQRVEQKYAFSQFAHLPAARSVTGGVMGSGSESSTSSAHAPQLDLPRFFAESRRQTAAEAGSAVHVALQHLDFSQPCDAADVRRQVAALVDRRLLTAVAAKGVDAEALAWLMTTPVGALLRTHQGALRRELPVFVPDDDLAVESSDPMDRPMVRGRIDVLVPTAAGPVLVDYKTDRLRADEVPGRAALHRVQLAKYRAAVERIVGQPVAGAHLVFLAARVVVEG